MPSLEKDGRDAARADARTAHWRSLDELADTPGFRAFVEREFPAVRDEVVNGESRRTFLKLMGASMAMAGLTACRWPRETIVPFAHRPEGFVPGEPVTYATAMDLDGAATGLLVTSYDGRPIKIEGNPNHPASLGSTSALAQAAVLEIYDPARSRSPIERQGNTEFARTWDEFDTAAGAIFARLRAQNGTGLRFLCQASSSPSLAGLRDTLKAALPNARWYEWEPISRDAEREGTRIAFGAPHRAQLRVGKADVIVAFESDFLHDHPDSVRHAREFADRRRGGDSMNRLWAVEGALSPTGASADTRYAVPPQFVPIVAMRLAVELASMGVVLPAGVIAAAQRAAGHPYASPFAAQIAADLAAARGRALVIAGAALPAEIHALVAAINVALGAVGETVVYTADPDDRPAHDEALSRLAGELRSGGVDTLVIIGANPVYAAPAELAFRDALGRVKNSIHVGLYRDETGRACVWHAPLAHFLETWGDARAWDGTLSIVQPLIAPIFGGRTVAEIVALALGTGPKAAYDITRAAFFGATGAAPDAEERWRVALNRGVVEGMAFAPASVTLAEASLASRLSGLSLPEGASSERDLGLVLIPSATVHDGRFANNAWLQETPDPISKVTWDNPLLVGPKTAEALGLHDEDRVKITVGGRSCESAVCITPGIAPSTVVLALGYGRTAAGPVGDNVGFDSYALRDDRGRLVYGGVAIERTGRRYLLATTQNHWAIDTLGRKEAEHRSLELIKTGTFEEYKKNPEFAKESQTKFFSLWKEFKYEGHAWGMAIDLSSCTGCNACAVACQAENNIPVVGKEQVARGREMNWIRVDRYYRGDPENPEVVFQPMACVHCENAPCEQVCPVGATTHSHEGLNQMAYNRCVGTRYCSNNCPYKVRRFNFFNYNGKLTELQMMQKNPEVTVRGRGVMEKCTYCVQRIENVKIKAKNDRRAIRDGEIVSACAQACPTRAIVFGDLNDPASQVRKLHESSRSYGLLAEINTKPRTHYLARLKNPAAGAAAQPHGEHA